MSTCSGQTTNIPSPPLWARTWCADSIDKPKLPASCGADLEFWSTISVGPLDIAKTVTTESFLSNPRSTCSGSQELRSSHSPKHMVNFMGLPSVERSVPPGSAPPMLRTANRTARPMVAFALDPWPSADIRTFSPIRSRMGPLMIMTGDAPMVVANTPWQLNSSVHMASIAAITTGKYSGRHPARTAFTAIFSTVAGAMFGGIVATSSWESRDVPSSIRITRSGVGGTTGRPSEKP